MHAQRNLSLFSPFLIPQCPSLSLFLSSVPLELTLSCSSSLGWLHCVSFLYSIFQCKLLGHKKATGSQQKNRERSDSPTLSLPLSQMRSDDPSLSLSPKKEATVCLFILNHTMWIWQWVPVELMNATTTNPTTNPTTIECNHNEWEATVCHFLLSLAMWIWWWVPVESMNVTTMNPTTNPLMIECNHNEREATVRLFLLNLAMWTWRQVPVESMNATTTNLTTNPLMIECDHNEQIQQWIQWQTIDATTTNPTTNKWWLNATRMSKFNNKSSLSLPISKKRSNCVSFLYSILQCESDDESLWSWWMQPWWIQ
jgi:hypothetical protein